MQTGTNIAHNEVKELLDEYVVSPVKEKINESISEIENMVSEEKENIDYIKRNISTLPNIIERELDKKLKTHTEDLVNELEIDDKLQTSVDKLKEQQETLTGDVETNFAQLLEKLQNLHTTLDSYGTYIKEEIPGILEKSNELSKSQDVKSENMEVLLQKMEASITSDIDKKYKLLMIASMSFNVVEIVGIISLILYLFLF